MQDVIKDPYAEKDEIDLIELFTVLVKQKRLIISIVFFTAVIAGTISLIMPDIYRSEAVICARSREKSSSINPLSALGGLGSAMVEGIGLGGGGTMEKLEVVLKSRNLTNRVIKKHRLMPVIFSDIWDKKKKEWNTDHPPTIQDGWKKMQNRLTVRMDTKKNTIKVGFDHENPEVAKKIVDYYLTELSEVLREEVLQDAAENMKFFRKQLEKTSDSLLKEKIYSLLANEIEKETFARAQKYYNFVVLDPPFIPDPDKNVKPKRVLICILSVVVAFFIAVFLAFLKEYIHQLKIEDPEHYQALLQGLKFSSRKNAG